MDIVKIKEQLKTVFKNFLNNKVNNEDKWITIHPNGEDAKGRPLLLKDGETPREALARAYGVDEAKGQQKLFPTKEFKKTREDFQREEQEQKDIFAQHQKKLETKYRNIEFAGTENPDELQDLSGEDVDFEEWEEKRAKSIIDGIKKDFEGKEIPQKVKDDFKKTYGIDFPEQKQTDTKEKKEDKKQYDTKDNEAVKRGLDEETVKKQIEKLKKGKGYSLSDKYKNPKHTMKVISLLKEAGISQIKKGFEAHENGERVFITLPQNILIEHENNLRKIFKKSKDIEDVYFGTPIRGLQNITIKFKKVKTNNSKEQDMALLDELKKLITKVENNKENEEMIDNEKVDKRKLIDEVGGILKGKVDDEIIRTIIKKMEEASYNDSEASADNKKVKNEDDEKKKVDNEDEDKKDDDKVDNEDEKDEEKVDELKKDEKKDVENKCKNSKGTSSFDKINAIYNSVRALKPQSTYTSRQEKLDNAVEYFKN